MRTAESIYRELENDPVSKTETRRLERAYLAAVFDRGSLAAPKVRHHRLHRTGQWAVYFLYAREANRVKIGVSKNIGARFASLSNMSPFPLERLGWIPGGVAVERALHTYLADQRRHGEWFEVTREVRRELHRFGVCFDDPLFS